MIDFPYKHLGTCTVSGDFAVREEYFTVISDDETEATIIYLAYKKDHGGKRRRDRHDALRELFNRTAEACFINGVIPSFSIGDPTLPELLAERESGTSFSKCFDSALEAAGVLEITIAGELPVDKSTDDPICDAGAEFFDICRQEARAVYKQFLGKDIAITDSLVWKPGDDESGIGCEMRHFDPPIQARIIETEDQHIGVWNDNDAMSSYYEIQITNREGQLGIGENILYISGPEWKSGQGWSAPDPAFTKWLSMEVKHAH